MAIDELVERFRFNLKLKGFSENTIAGYMNDLKGFAEFFSDKPLNEQNLLKYRDELAKKNFTTSTFNRKLSSIRAFLKFLNRSGLLEIDYSLLRNKRNKRKAPNYIAKDTIEKAMTNDRDGLIIRMMYATGLRISELVNLKVSDILFDGGFVRIKGKGNKERFVPIDRKTLEAIKKYVGTRGFSYKGYLFLSNRKKPFTRQGMWKVVKRKFRKLGLDVKPHMLRHMFATHMLENGANIRAVQEMLGHESVTTTQIYTEITDNSLKEAFNKFDVIK